MKTRVVITGLGAITPVGIGKEAFWQALTTGKSGIDTISRFDVSEYPAQIAGEVRDFEPTLYIDKKEAKRMDRTTQFAKAAAGMALTLRDAGMQLSEVDYINAHGTSTAVNDKNETLAIRAVFGPHADRLAVSSTKSMTGHLLGAVGGIECIAVALSIENGLIPPTINYELPDLELELDYVPNKARRQIVNAALSNSFGFGGHNAVLALRKYND